MSTQTENDLAELCRLQADEIVQLRAVCRKAIALCNQCLGRGIVSDEVLGVLAEALEGEAK